ncbi:zinc finger protein OZF-like isoform X2 [Bactrocera neohumeralis]|uniref:zinc finger protein OZF-like isoform X2 n=1 Tax=Bactrocera tryoni TaxID=59916 RepID=UPI001A999615|nr:zinc finger protein OZF-like isoform X2 [Bactrocera tryoni]XP_050329964.1 zinc finger protein OZF-like isoform X2 [Bactrocera neohumeralis]
MQDFTNETLEFDDIEVLKALEDCEYADDNDCNDINEDTLQQHQHCDGIKEIIENTTSGEINENSQSLENAFTKRNESGYVGNANVSTEISIVNTEVDKQVTNDAEHTETIEPNSASSDAYFRPVQKFWKNIDEKERPLKCRFCDTTFNKVNILRKHEERHSNNRPFSCTKCPKKFFSRTELNTHIRWHTGEKPFVCTFCGKSYTTKGALSNHEKRHVGEPKYKCDHCDRRFYEPFHVRNHSVVHTKERNYTCDQCQAKFSRPTTLRMHMKLHENALRYTCKICKMRFNQKPTLIWHEKSKHAIVGGGAASSNIAVTNLSQELSDNEDTKYRYTCCNTEFKDNDSFLKHQNDEHAEEAIASLEALEETDSEYVDFI